MCSGDFWVFPGHWGESDSEHMFRMRGNRVFVIVLNFCYFRGVFEHFVWFIAMGYYFGLLLMRQCPRNIS